MTTAPVSRRKASRPPLYPLALSNHQYNRGDLGDFPRDEYSHRFLDGKVDDCGEPVSNFHVLTPCVSR
jgi:hypothetical protein